MDAKRGDDNCHSDYNAFLAASNRCSNRTTIPRWGKDHTLAECNTLR